MFKTRFTAIAAAIVIFQLFYFDLITFEWAALLMSFLTVLTVLFFCNIYIQYNVYQQIDEEENIEE